MLRTALLISLVLGVASPVCAQSWRGPEPVRASYTMDEYVEVRRPLITKRKFTPEEKAQADKLISTINSMLKKKELVPSALLEQLALLAETGDRNAMKAMMLGYRGAAAVSPLPADIPDIMSSTPNGKLAGLWAMMLWKEGDHSKEVSQGIDGCWRANNPPPGQCGYTVKAKDDFRNVFNLHWTEGKGPPKDVVFTEYSLRPSPEKQKERFDKFLAHRRNGGEYTSAEYMWAEVWAKREGGEYPAMLEAAQRAGYTLSVSRDAVRAVNAKMERDEQVAKWDKLQAQRLQAKAEGGKLSTAEEADWINLSHTLGGKYLVPFASENVLMFAMTIDSLCSGDSGPVCQRQRQLYQYRAEAALSEHNIREGIMRSMTLGGRGDVSVRSYDSSGNYLGTTTMPAWQADIAGAH
jgi:hypothetical protein